MTIHDQSMTSSAATGQPPTFIALGQGSASRRIAVRARAGGSPGLFWLGGFKSDMMGTKAVALDAWAAERHRACVRFDYSGNGESGGDFIDGTIGRWLEESVAVFEQFCAGPQVVIGSSMGGWMALLLARELARRQANRASLAGLVLIALGPPATAGWWATAGLFVYGVSAVTWTVNVTTLRQLATPREMLGRVTATMRVLSYSVIPLAALTGGALGSAVGLRPALGVAAAGAVVAALAMIASPLPRERSLSATEVTESAEAAAHG